MKKTNTLVQVDPVLWLKFRAVMIQKRELKGKALEEAIKLYIAQFENDLRENH